jgi:hypothetical protein
MTTRPRVSKKSGWPVKATPTPNISTQVPTNVSRISYGFEPRAIGALTPKAAVRVKINANVSPKATPMDAWLASSRSTDGLAAAPLGGASSVPQVSARGHAGWTVWIAVVRMQKT